MAKIRQEWMAVAFDRSANEIKIDQLDKLQTGTASTLESGWVLPSVSPSYHTAKQRLRVALFLNQNGIIVRTVATVV